MVVLWHQLHFRVQNNITISLFTRDVTALVEITSLVPQNAASVE